MNLNVETISCGAFETNAYLVSIPDRDDAFLIDPGDDYPALARAIERSGRK